MSNLRTNNCNSTKEAITNHIKAGAYYIKIESPMTTLTFRNDRGVLSVLGSNTWRDIIESDIDSCLSGLKGSLDIIATY